MNATELCIACSRKKDTMSAKHEPELPMDINNTWRIVLTQTFKELQSWPCAALTE